MIIDKKVIINWNPTNKDYFIDKGYKFTKMKDKIEVVVKDLSTSSNVIVSLKCDYCGNIFQRKYEKVIRGRSIIKKDACSECKSKKTEEANVIKYGVKNTFQSEKIN